LIVEAITPTLKEYDFIYTKGFTGWELLEQRAQGKISCRAPIGINFHGYEMFQRAPGLKARFEQILLLRAPVRRLTKMADCVFSYGGKITRIIQSIGIKNEKIMEMPSGVESGIIVPMVNTTEGKRKFVFIGRYERRKGIEELNSVIRNLPEDLNAEFHFIGPIPEDKKLKRMDVWYHGELRSKDEVFDRLRSCHILLCPSWSEGMPNVILEGMASGLAVIATDVGATQILVDQNTGWLIPPGNKEELRRAIMEAVLLEPEKLIRKRQCARALIEENFTWELLSKSLINEIRRRSESTLTS
jgi:glycosyltransferase involved in cell wall biosynthesis